MIHIVYRTYKAITDNKPRPNWFSKEKCFNSLVNPITNDSNFKLHILFNGESNDLSFRPELLRYQENIHYIYGHSAAESYVNATKYCYTLPIQDWVYLVEDDYLHHPNWVNILLKMTYFNGYLTLYDHPDKYNKEMYPNLKSELFKINDLLVRTTPSTTDTFCVPVYMFREDYTVHYNFSDGVKYSRDHERFTYLTSNKNRKIYSPVPGYSVHCHEPHCNVREDYFD